MGVQVPPRPQFVPDRDDVNAHTGEGFDGHGTPADEPLVVLLSDEGTDQADHRGALGEDADDVGAPADLPVEPLLGIVRPDLAPVLVGEGALPAATRLG